MKQQTSQHQQQSKHDVTFKRGSGKLTGHFSLYKCCLHIPHWGFDPSTFETVLHQRLQCSQVSWVPTFAMRTLISADTQHSSGLSSGGIFYGVISSDMQLIIANHLHNLQQYPPPPCHAGANQGSVSGNFPICDAIKIQCPITCEYECGSSGTSRFEFASVNGELLTQQVSEQNHINTYYLWGVRPYKPEGKSHLTQGQTRSSVVDTAVQLKHEGGDRVLSNRIK